MSFISDAIAKRKEYLKTRIEKLEPRSTDAKDGKSILGMVIKATRELEAWDKLLKRINNKTEPNLDYKQRTAEFLGKRGYKDIMDPFKPCMVKEIGDKRVRVKISNGGVTVICEPAAGKPPRYIASPARIDFHTPFRTSCDDFVKELGAVLDRME